MKWFEDDTVSIEDLVLLTLEVEVSKTEKPKFTLRKKTQSRNFVWYWKDWLYPNSQPGQRNSDSSGWITPRPSKPKRRIPFKNYIDEDAESDSDIDEGKKGKWYVLMWT